MIVPLSFILMILPLGCIHSTWALAWLTTIQSASAVLATSQTDYFLRSWCIYPVVGSFPFRGMAFGSFGPNLVQHTVRSRQRRFLSVGDTFVQALSSSSSSWKDGKGMRLISVVSVRRWFGLILPKLIISFSSSLSFTISSPSFLGEPAPLAQMAQRWDYDILSSKVSFSYQFPFQCCRLHIKLPCMMKCYKLLVF